MRSVVRAAAQTAPASASLSSSSGRGARCRISSLCSPSPGERLTVDGRVGQREGTADRRVAPPLRVVDVDDQALGAQPLVLDQVLGAEHRAARHVDAVELRRTPPTWSWSASTPRCRPKISSRRAQARLGRRVVRVLDELGLADLVHQRLPHLRLDDHVEPRVRCRAVVVLACSAPPSRAGRRPTRCPRAGTKSSNSLFGYSLSGPCSSRCWSRSLTRQRLRIPPAHRDLHALAAPRVGALVERGADRAEQVHGVARVADLGARGDRRAVLEARRAHRAAGGLGDVLVGLGVLQRARGRSP